MLTYSLDRHVAEVYDATETYTDDIALIRRLIGASGPLRIREPFCGTGRILIPLAKDGHTLLGTDLADGMLDRAREKAAALIAEARARIELRVEDALQASWGSGFDLVILGANCLYEFGSEEQQEECVRRAAACLRDGGWLYMDNNARRGRVCDADVGARTTFPSGTCRDGTRLESQAQIVAVDPVRNLWHSRRRVQVIRPGGEAQSYEWEPCTHPVSMEGMCRWLEANGLVVLSLFGNRQGAPFTPDTNRAIFWAQKGPRL